MTPQQRAVAIQCLEKFRRELARAEAEHRRIIAGGIQFNTRLCDAYIAGIKSTIADLEQELANGATEP